MCVGIVCISFKGPAVGSNGIGAGAKILKRDADVERRCCVVGSNGEGSPVVYKGGVDIAGLMQDPAQVDVGVGKLRLPFQNLAIGMHGLLRGGLLQSARARVDLLHGEGRFRCRFRC